MFGDVDDNSVSSNSGQLSENDGVDMTEPSNVDADQAPDSNTGTSIGSEGTKDAD